ncbi:hypothetical protein KHS38_10720 [Mucilaginibacter sp. Bleaf8]|uniref:hypothetical protein n=1 Tax=Mucilaginibacter sp. Bleaf8 TaxID=2834430 RepID=UPI001BCC213E|nr:hypothetical protein [Mucilaginibacter sp. Bleaf8]MBS7564878.1 hypothetical protein [Mucilaginibacter sp. Bleaf8]
MLNIKQRYATLTLVFITAIFLLFSCQQPAKKKSSITITSKKDSSVKTVVQQNAASETNSADFAEEDECPKGVAEPVLSKKLFPDAVFKLDTDRRSGIETVQMSNGDKLTVQGSGCEYYMLTFRFETSRFSADTTNLPYWFDKAAVLMRELDDKKAIDCPLEIGTGIHALISKVQKSGSSKENGLQLEDEIVYIGPDPRQFVSVNRIQRLSEQRYAVEVMFGYGPI